MEQAKELYKIIKQSEVNRVISETIKAHEGKVGQYVDDKGQPGAIPQNVQDSMTAVAEMMAHSLLELNRQMLTQGVTAASSDEYVNFLSDLLPKFVLIEPSEVTRLEVETAVMAQVESTPIAEMREAIVARNYANQKGEQPLTLEQVRSQLQDLDDGTVKEAFHTMLLSQLN